MHRWDDIGRSAERGGETGQRITGSVDTGHAAQHLELPPLVLAETDEQRTVLPGTAVRDVVPEDVEFVAVNVDHGPGNMRGDRFDVVGKLDGVGFRAADDEFLVVFAEVQPGLFVPPLLKNQDTRPRPGPARGDARHRGGLDQRGILAAVDESRQIARLLVVPPVQFRGDGGDPGESVAQFRCPIEQDGAFPSGEPHPQVVRSGRHRETVSSADRIVPVGSILRCVRGSGGTPQAGPDPHDHVGTALRVGGRNPEQRPKRFLQRLGAIEIELQVCVLRVSLGKDSRLRHGHGDTLPGKSSILATPDRSPRIFTASSVRSLRKWWLPATKTSDGGATAMNAPIIAIPWPAPWAVRNRGNTTRGARRQGWRRFVP